MTWKYRRGPAALVLVLIAATACTDNVIGPDNQLEVSNQPGIFEWQVTALDDVTQTLSYSWENPGTEADVNVSSSLTGGSATVVVLDDAGTEVYGASLGQNGTFATSTGITGTWTVRVVLEGARGSLNFRLDTP